jgi:hypothetical protein
VERESFDNLRRSRRNLLAAGGLLAGAALSQLGAIYLVNGSSITLQSELSEIEYLHVKLARHDGLSHAARLACWAYPYAMC